MWNERSKTISVSFFWSKWSVKKTQLWLLNFFDNNFTTKPVVQLSVIWFFFSFFFERFHLLIVKKRNLKRIIWVHFELILVCHQQCFQRIQHRCLAYHRHQFLHLMLLIQIRYCRSHLKHLRLGIFTDDKAVKMRL